MKNILIIGATGQIGSELTMLLRKSYTGNVVAGYIPGEEPKGELKEYNQFAANSRCGNEISGGYHL